MVEILDCTLRDGGNVVGAGFGGEATVKIIEALIDGGIRVIEMGHCSGVGGNSSGVKTAPLSDEEYAEIAYPYFSKAEIGMFCQPRWTDAKGVRSIAKKGLGFLRVGINAGDSARAAPLVEEIKSCGVKARTSLMKAYALEPAELASEARALEEYGADAVTIMDSAGYMMPDDAARYVEVVAGEVSIPVGFHGHNNLGLSVANGLAAWRAGAASIDCGVMGMARSVGNIPTEVFIAVLQRLGEGTEYDLHSLLSRIDGEIARLTEGRFHNPIPPLHLVLGMAGCHSQYLPVFREAAEKHGANLYRLIMEVSAEDRRTPSAAMIDSYAKKAGMR